MSIRPEDLDMLARVPLFCTLPAEALQRITAPGTIQRYKPDTILFSQGDVPASLFVLLEGQVGMLGISPDGEETVVEIFKPGEVLLAPAVLMNRPYLMTAQVLQPARILSLPADPLRADLKQNAELAFAMLTSLSHHWRQLVREVKNLKLKSSAQRFGAYLLSLTGVREGPATIRLPYHKTFIAARVGIRPESLSRIINQLKSIGVQVRAQDVAIADVAKLADFCREEDEDDAE